MSVVRITGTSGTESKDQLDAALVDRGLDRATVTELPFGLDTSLATNLAGLFEGMAALEVVPSMYILNVTVMDGMFDGCAALTSIPDLRTGNVTSAVRMLADTPALVDGQVRLIGRNQGVDTTDMIAGSGLTREPFYDEITAPPPTFDDVYVEVILPDIDVVEYTVIGEPERGEQVRVTAAPVGWVVLTGITEWVHTFPSVEGPSEPVPGDQTEEPPQPQMPLPGSYASRNAGRRASILEAFTQIVNQSELDEVDRKAEDAANEVHNLGTVVTDYGNILERKVEPWAVPTVAPLSQTINRRADPTFGLSDFFIPRLDLAGNTRGADGHFHALTGDHANAGRVEQSLQGGADTKGRIYFAFITPAINRAYEQLNFMVGDVTSPCQMDVAVYVVDEDTKVLSRQIYVEDALVGHGIGESVATVTFPTWIATQGSYLAVAFLQHGSGNTRQLLGLNETPRPLMNNVFPRKISAIHAHIDWISLPLGVDGETTLDFEGYWFNPYAELSENVGIDYRTFTENWPDVGVAQRPWVALPPGMITSRGGYTSAGGVGTRVAIYDTPLSTDYVRVRTSVYRLFDNNQYSFIAVRATNDMTAGVGLVVSNDYGYRLVEWSGTNHEMGTQGTVIQSIARPPQEGDQIEIDYLNGQVTVRINGVVEIDNAAAGGPQGAAGRFVGLRLRRDRTGIPVFYSYHPSPWLGPWSARDLPQGNGDDDGDEDGDGEDEG